MHPPTSKMAARDFYPAHKERIQEEMWKLGTQYAGKPGVVCCFGVMIHIIDVSTDL